MKKQLAHAVIYISLATAPLTIYAEEQSEDIATLEETIRAQFEQELIAQQNKINELEQHTAVIRDEFVETSNELEQVKKELEQALKKYEYYQKQLEKAKAELLKSEKNNKQLNKDLQTAQQKILIGVPVSALAGFVIGYFLPSLHS